MNKFTPSLKNIPDAYKIAFLALALSAISFFLQADYGINMPDEGFLWYGAIHTHLGQVPIRDFQSYDPGRYYWLAFFFSFLGDGFKAFRISLALFQCVGLFFGLLAARRALKSYPALAAFGVILVLWMLVPFRYFEYCLPAIAVFFAVRLLEDPTPRRHFAAGLFTGAAIFFGTNHGLYSFFAFDALIVLGYLKEGRRDLMQKQSAFLGGILVGSLPLILMLVFIPGFFESYRAAMSGLARHGTNMSWPALWPWNVSWRNICQTLPSGLPRLLEWCNEMSTAVLFLVVPVFYFLSGCFLIFRRKPLSETPLWAACAAIGAAYLHHIFSRSDAHHLAEGIAPFLLGLLAFHFFFKKHRKEKIVTAVVLFFFLMGILAAGLLDPFCFKYFTPKDAMATYKMGQDKVWMTRGEADRYENIQKVVSENVGAGETMLILPNWPAFYCILQRTSPLHEIYFLWPASQESQERSIRTLEEKKVNWVLFNRDMETYFRSTDALLWKYFKENFEAASVPNKGYNYWLLRRKIKI